MTFGFVRRTLKFSLGAVAVAGCLVSQSAQAQAPYALPYTIQTYAGGGAAVTTGQACAGGVGTSFDTYGDGCPITSSSVSVGLAGSDIHDVVVDQQGNVYFLDNGANGVIRRIDGRTGIITVYAGSYVLQSQCATATTKFGDTCVANDGKANANGLFTGNFGKARGLAVARNGDVYMADYGQHLIQKISAATGILSIVAGSPATAAKATSNGGVKGYSGDGTLAYTGPSAQYSSGQGAALNAPRGVGVDLAGNVYIADSSNNVVRKVNAATGVISTIGGAYPNANTAATAGFGGDGGPAASAATLFTTPEDVEIDASGNVFIADQGNARVRVIYAGGTAVAGLIAKTNSGQVAVAGNIYTVVGGSTTVFTPGTQVLATSVLIGVRKISLDSRGNLYVADGTNDVIWFVDITTGFMRPIAGTFGVTSASPNYCAQKTDAVGDNCPATQATLNPNNAMGVSIDSLGQLYITDPSDNRLRKVYTGQVFSPTAVGATVSQTLQIHFAAGDSPAAANAYTLTGSTDFSVTGSACTTNTDTTQDCLVTVAYKPTTTGKAAAALNVASTGNGVSIIGITGSGTGAALALDPGATAAFGTGYKTPSGITQDAAGNTYLADTGSNRVLRVSPAGTVTVVAGTGTSGYTGDGAAATLATLNGPQSVAYTRHGYLYIADTGNSVIRRVDPATGFITTVAGGASAVCSTANDAVGNGCLATAATLSKPAGIAADPDGNIFISDTGNNLIRELSASGYLLYVAGAGTPCAASMTNGVDSLGNNCAPNQTTFNAPTGITVDTARNVYIADTGNSEVRELAIANNTVLRLAGTGQPGQTLGSSANNSQLAAPQGVAVDAGGDVYIADTGNSAVRVVNGGVLSTVAGALGTPGTGVLPGTAYTVQFASPAGVFSNGAGRLTIVDTGNNRVITDDRGSVVYNFGRTNLGSASPTLLIQETSTGTVPATLASPLTVNTGDTGSFTLVPTGSAGCGSGPLAPGTSCSLIAQFTPASLGPLTATYTEAGITPAVNPVPFIQLKGTGATLTTTTSTSVVNGSPQFSAPFTVVTTVVPAACNTGAPSCSPTGTVQFMVDGANAGAPITLVATANGATATQSFSTLPVGKHSIVAVYSGDDNYGSSTAPAVIATVVQGSTTTTVVAASNPSAQFASNTLTATVKSTTTNIPSGTVSFYAGKTLLRTIPLSGGVAPLPDTTNSFGLTAGTYTITAVYSGDANYAPSTSAGLQLVISPDAPAFVISPPTPTPGATPVGTAQGSTGQLNVTVTPTNTVNGAVTFSCTGLPTFSVCTFSPTQLVFTAVAGSPSPQTVQVTLWTDVPPGVIPTSAALSRPVLGRNMGTTAMASLLGWPVLLLSMLTMFGFRKRLRGARLLSALALFGILAGGSAVLSGCSGGQNFGNNVTPTGVYQVKMIATGPGGTTYSLPIQFTVGTGVAGQL